MNIQNSKLPHLNMPFRGTCKRIDHKGEHCRQRKMPRERCATSRGLILEVDLRHNSMCQSGWMDIDKRKWARELIGEGSDCANTRPRRRGALASITKVFPPLSWAWGANWPDCPRKAGQAIVRHLRHDMLRARTIQRDQRSRQHPFLNYQWDRDCWNVTRRKNIPSSSIPPRML